MLRTRVSLILLAASAIALAPLAGSAALAATATAPAPGGVVTWSVSPSSAKGPDGRESFAYSVNPGVQITDYVSVTNQGKQAATFTLYATDGINDFDTGSFSLLPSSTKPKDVGAWTKLAAASITLKAGTQAHIPFTILVPSDATPGDHTAGVIASIFTEGKNSKGEAITLEQRVAARIYLAIAGKASASVEGAGQVVSFASPINPFSGGTAGVDYSVRNTGNYRVDVEQTVDIKGPFGIPLAHLRGKRVLNLLPGQAVHEKADVAGIPPLLFLTSTVTLAPAPPTDVVKLSKQRDQAGKLVPVAAPPSYRAISNDATGAAVPWTLLLLVVILAGVVWVVARYINASRQSVYDAIDAAEAARSAEKEPVA